MHAVVVPCSAEGGEAAEEGEGDGLGEVQVVAGDFGDDGEAALKERERVSDFIFRTLGQQGVTNE